MRDYAELRQGPQPALEKERGYETSVASCWVLLALAQPL